MIEVVSVKFKGQGKTYFFDPAGIEVPVGAQVVVETSKGLELCECVQGNHTVTDARIVPPLRQVVRLATADDLRVAALCKMREKEAFAIAEKKIAAHGLEMKLVDVECNFEGNKMLFFFTSDGRVDFRELVKDLAGEFRTRIELRQIGVRDEAKRLGGIGMCGRPYCCNQFLDDFAPVSTKMAKTQSLSLNPTKISGCCGRLMCCLRYEEDAYEELVKTLPKNGAFVETVAGYGSVVQVNLLRQKVKVRLDGEEDGFRTFEADEVAAVPGGRPKPGEPLPHVLQAKPKCRMEAADVEDPWMAPPVFAEDTAHETPEKPAEDERRHHSRHRGSRGGRPKPQPGEPTPVHAEAAPAGSAEGAPRDGAPKSHHHRGGRGRGGKKPAEGQAPGGEKQSAEARPKPQKPTQPKPQSGEPGASGGEKKPTHRSHRGGRGRGHGGNGSGAPAAPKAE